MKTFGTAHTAHSSLYPVTRSLQRAFHVRPRCVLLQGVISCPVPFERLLIVEYVNEFVRQETQKVKIWVIRVWRWELCGWWHKSVWWRRSLWHWLLRDLCHFWFGLRGVTNRRTRTRTADASDQTADANLKLRQRTHTAMRSNIHNGLSNRTDGDSSTPHENVYVAVSYKLTIHKCAHTSRTCTRTHVTPGHAPRTPYARTLAEARHSERIHADVSRVLHTDKYCHTKCSKPRTPS